MPHRASPPTKAPTDDANDRGQMRLGIGSCRAPEDVPDDARSAPRGGVSEREGERRGNLSTVHCVQARGEVNSERFEQGLTRCAARVHNWNNLHSPQGKPL
jgi:hypothetical protein